MENIGNIVAGILMAGLPLLVFEIISRKYKVSPEITRKAIHVLSAMVIAYMTLFLSLNEIAFISALFFVFLVITRQRRIWKSIYSVERSSYGEVLFAVGVILAAIIAQDEKIFACAVLVMGLADPAAAIIGQRFKKSHKLLGAKTIEGTVGFFLISVFLFGAFGVLSFPAALFVGIIVSTVELVSTDGLDNIAVPVAVSLLLNYL